MRKSFRWAAALIACAACSGKSTTTDMSSINVPDLAMFGTTGDMARTTTTTGDMAMAMITGDMAMMMGGNGMVPDPGNANPFNYWPDNEPNGTSDTASPAGTYPMGMAQESPYFIPASGGSGNSIGGADKVDYYVFKTTDAAMFTLGANGLCYSDPAGVVNATLYQVTNGKQGAVVHQWTTVTHTATNSCVSSDAAMPAQLAAGGVYLLAITAVNVASPIGYEA